MPRPLGITAAEGLPLWDTVEAVYFLVAGLSAGAVVGFLFPSIWRAFRRKFRNTKRFSTALPVESITAPIKAFDETPEEVDARHALAAFPIESLFVHARSLVQGGRPRDAVQVYLDVLGDERVSKGETNRALFELAQTYALVGLSGRAFDVAFELLSRKPKHRQAFEFLMGLILRSQRYERILEILPVWRGDADAKLRLRIAHAICEHGDRLLRSGNVTAARDMAALATRWSFVSARARVVLWQATSEDVLAKAENDVRRRWIALAADFDSLSRIYSEMTLSPMAVASYLRRVLTTLGQNSESAMAFADIQSEFITTSGVGRAGEKNTRRTVDNVVLYAVLSESQGWKSTAAETFLPMAGFVSPQLILKISSMSAALGAASDLALQTGLRVHRCRSCGGVTGEFAWSCPHCSDLETLLPMCSLGL